ncbi:MAG: hypothetical protein H6700_10445 [Myxococcales bacterium]|nr:hypothetical protein [Myxococcales bacterium]
MATRRGAANLDDLKARLGYAEPAAGEPSALDATPGAGSEDAADDDAAPAAAPTASAPTPAPAPQRAQPAAPTPALEEDYSNAVSTADVRAFEFDANAVDPTIKAPASGSLVATAIAAATALIIGLVAGIAGVTSNSARKLENAATDEATAMLDRVRPVAAMLTSLDADVASIPADTEFRADFQERLAAAYSGDVRALDAGYITNAATLMIRDESLGRHLVEYSISSQLLAAQVDRHLQACERDADEIQRLQAGLADSSNYGVAVELESQLNRFQAFAGDPDSNPFQPIGGERVTYDTLDMIIEGDGAARREYYQVTNAAGEPMRVLVHDLVLMQREQLLPPVSRENALDRYRARTALIKELLSNVTSQQAELVSDLEQVAQRPKYFTF